MEIKKSDKVFLSAQGEKGEYHLILPIGSSLEEAAKVSAGFTSTLSKAWEEYKTKHEEEKTEEKKEDGLPEQD